MGILLFVFILSIGINIIVILAGLYLVNYKGGISFLKLLLKNYRDTGKVMSGDTSITDRTNELLMFKPTENDVVFLGDSITQGGKWSELFPDISARNWGIGGDKTINVLNRLTDITKNKPQKIFLLIGINDLVRRFSQNEILNNIESIILKINSDSENTKVYIESILPLNEDKIRNVYEQITKTPVTVDNNQISIFNSNIKELCVKYDVTFIDMYTDMLDEHGHLDERYTSDGLHLSYAGYFRMGEILNDYVYENSNKIQLIN